MTVLSKVTSSKQQAHISFLFKLVLTEYKRICSALVNSLARTYIKVIQPGTPNKNFKYYKNSDRFDNERGFTLVELIVTVTILAIIATIAAPAISTQLANMEAKRIKSQLTTTLTIAKSESYIRRQNLLICLSNTGGRCNRDSYKKLLLFIDNNDNQHFDVQTDQLLNEQILNPKYGTLGLRVGNKRHYTKFWGDSGKPRGHFGHIKYCPTSTYNKNMYQISFNQSGIIKNKPNSKHPSGC